MEEEEEVLNENVQLVPVLYVLFYGKFKIHA